MDGLIAYTVCLGGYDEVRPPPPDPRVRWMLFTDGEPVDGFETVRIPSGWRRESRNIKINSHLLPPHEASVYFDACQEWTRSPADMLAELPTGAEWIGSRHPSASNAWAHAAQVKRFRLDRPEVVDEVLREMEPLRQAMKCLPFTENNLIVRRNTDGVRRCNEAWWRRYCAGSQRDQMSLPAAFLDSGMRPATFPFSGRANPWCGGFLRHRDSSARKVESPRVVVAVVAIGRNDLHRFTLPTIQAFAERHGYALEIISDAYPHSSPYWAKFKAGEFFESHAADCVLLMDADVMVKPGSPSPVDLAPQSGVWAFDSMSLPYMADRAREQQARYRKLWLEQTGETLPETPHYINSGVCVVWKDARDFLSPPEHESAVSVSKADPAFDDQNLMNARTAGRFHPLPRAWNFGHVSRGSNLDEAKKEGVHFIHLNGCGNKVVTAAQVKAWPCFHAANGRGERT